FVLLLADADHPGHQRSGRGKVIRRERKPFRIEVVDRQVAVRVDDDWAGIFIDRLRVNAVGKAFLDNNGIGEVTLRLREQVADTYGFSSTAHAKQNSVLRGFAVAFAGESLHAHKI